MLKVKRKYCRLHGWAPHRTGVDESGIEHRSCYRCTGVEGYTKSAKIMAFFRGFKLPRSIRYKDFLNGRF